MRNRAISSEEARQKAKSAAGVLSSDERVRLVFVFGSSQTADRPVRDVDLAVRTEPRLSVDALMRLRAEVVHTARGPIDLVSLNDASIVLAFEVASTGRCLFAREPEDEVDFVLRARKLYWDFKPFLDEQWKLAGQRLEERRLGIES